MWTVQVLVVWQSGAIDTPARLLRLLVLFSSRSSWSATELTDRLEVTPRTLRRDVTRLRDLGYPIESTTGRYGGYALGAGGRLPPLLLDDDEAVAVSVGLRDLSRSADPMLGEAAVAAMTKLLQVMPSALRERVDTLGEVTVRVGRAAPRGSTTSGRPTSRSCWPWPRPAGARTGCASTTAPATTAPAGATSSPTASCRCATAGTSWPSTSTATTGGRSASTASTGPAPTGARSVPP